jgi:hypothetical protein
MTTEKLTEEQQGALRLLNARIFVGNPCPKTWGAATEKREAGGIEFATTANRRLARNGV